MIKLFCLREQWTEAMVRNAVIKGWITDKECEDILSLCEEFKRTNKSIRTKYIRAIFIVLFKLAHCL